MPKRKERLDKEEQQELMDLLVKKVYKQGMNIVYKQKQKLEKQGKNSKAINKSIGDAESWRNMAYFLRLLGCKRMKVSCCVDGKPLKSLKTKDYTD